MISSVRRQSGRRCDQAHRVASSSSAHLPAVLTATLAALVPRNGSVEGSVEFPPNASNPILRSSLAKSPTTLLQ